MHRLNSEALRPAAENYSDEASSECILIKSTSVCAPYKNVYIDAKRLAKVYGVDKIDAKSWEKIVLDITSGGESQAILWKNWAQCPKYSGQPIQYFRSYVCLTDIFLYSANCNQNVTGFAQMCPETCNNYVTAASSLLSDEQYCPSNSSKIIHYLRRLVPKALNECQNITKSNPSSNKNKCFKGVNTDSASCGFSGNKKIAQDYCQEFSADPCCKNRTQQEKLAPSSQSHQSIFDVLHRTARIWHGPATNQSLLAPAGQNTILGYSTVNFVIIICVSISALLTLIAFVIFFRRYKASKREHAGMARLHKRRTVSDKDISIPLVGKSSALEQRVTNAEKTVLKQGK